MEKCKLPCTVLANGLQLDPLVSDGLSFLSSTHSPALDHGELSLVSQAKPALQHQWDEPGRVSAVGPSNAGPAAYSLSGLALYML